MYIPKEYKKSPGFLFDYAVLELETEENLEEYFGSFGYDFLQADYQFQKTIKNMTIVGYPLSKELTEYNG